MKKHYCDQTGKQIEGAIIKVTVMPPENGYALTPKENEIMQTFYEKDFSSLGAMADYIKKNHPNM